MKTNKPQFSSEVLETKKMSPESEEMLKEAITAYTAMFLEKLSKRLIYIEKGFMTCVLAKHLRMHLFASLNTRCLSPSRWKGSEINWKQQQYNTLIMYRYNSINIEKKRMTHSKKYVKVPVKNSMYIDIRNVPMHLCSANSF